MRIMRRLSYGFISKKHCFLIIFRIFEKITDCFEVMGPNKVIRVTRYESPCGELLLGELEGELCLCDWAAKAKRAATDRSLKALSGAEYVLAPSPAARMAAKQLDEYFAGRRTVFDVPLRLFGTEFRQRVWRTLLEIPYGTTLSYGALAERMGDSRAVRAVAAANGANPVSIFVPCHRVIGRDGRPVGYGGGLDVKLFLLDLEAGQRRLMR